MGVLKNHKFQYPSEQHKYLMCATGSCGTEPTAGTEGKFALGDLLPIKEK